AVEGQLPARAWAAAGAALAQIRLAGPAGLRDPARALFPASRALGLAPGAPEYQAVLALAHYRLGRLNEARLQAEGANKPSPGGNAVAWCAGPGIRAAPRRPAGPVCPGTGAGVGAR